MFSVEGQLKLGFSYVMRSITSPVSSWTFGNTQNHISFKTPILPTIGLNMAKEEIKINCEKDPEGLHSRVPKETLQIASLIKDGLDSVKKGSHYLLMDL